MMRRQSKTRQPVKQMALEAKLRRQIVAGTLGPGDRLPTREVLQRRHRVSAITVQRALDHLIATGFVEAKGTLGTFVTDRPPHLHRYGMVFFAHPGYPNWVRYQQVLSERAQVLRVRSGIDLVPVYCVDGVAGAGHAQLVAEVQDQQFAGLFFPYAPWPIHGSPILAGDAGIARVTTKSADTYPGFGVLEMDRDSLLQRAFAWFAERGRRRLAVVVATRTPADWDFTSARDHGLAIEPWNIQCLLPDLASSARALGHLLVRGPRDERPDALYITDDNLVDETVAGVLDAGLRIGIDLDIVGHANFPIVVNPALPIRRLGFDVDDLLDAAVGALTDLRRRPRSPATRVLSAVFAEEAASMRRQARGGAEPSLP